MQHHGIGAKANAIRITCNEFLQRYTGRCIGCGQGKHGKYGPEPNFCSSALLRPPDGSCFMCYQTTHKYHTIKMLMETGDDTPDGARCRQEIRDIGCVVISKVHDGYYDMQPCTTCWLVHDKEASPCTPDNRYLARSCFLMTWKRIGEFRRWLERVSPGIKLDEWKRFRDFVDWGVFHDYEWLHNVYRVVLFVKEELKKDKN